MSTLIDLTGRHFGRLTVLSLHPERDSRSSAARRPYTPQAAAASIHHRMPLTSAADNPDNHYPTYISDNPERDVASIARRGRRSRSPRTPSSTRNGMIRVTYGSSCKATQMGGMKTPRRDWLE